MGVLLLASGEQRPGYCCTFHHAQDSPATENYLALKVNGAKGKQDIMFYCLLACEVISPGQDCSLTGGRQIITLGDSFKNRGSVAASTVLGTLETLKKT